MKIYIGKYVSYINSYTISDKLKFFGLSEKKCYEVGNWLNNTWVKPFLNWIYDKKKRVVYTKIDDYDVWNLDNTLAQVILPALKEYRKITFAIPSNIHDTAGLPYPTETDEEYEIALKKWHETLDKMIWSFEQITSDYEQQFYSVEGEIADPIFKDGQLNWKTKPTIDFDALKHHDKKIQEGLDLFGKYYRNLWD